MNSSVFNDKLFALTIILLIMLVIGQVSSFGWSREEILTRRARQTVVNPGQSGTVEDAKQQTMIPPSTRGWIDLNKGTYTNNFWPNWQNMNPNMGPTGWFSRFNQPIRSGNQAQDYSLMNRMRSMVGMNNNNNTSWNNAGGPASSGPMLNGMNEMPNSAGMNDMNMMNRMDWVNNGMNNGFRRDSNPWYTPRGMMNAWNNMMPNVANSSFVRSFRGMMPNSMMPNSMTSSSMMPNSMMPNSMMPNSMMPNSMMPNSMMSKPQDMSGSNDMMKSSSTMTTTTTMSSAV